MVVIQMVEMVEQTEMLVVLDLLQTEVQTFHLYLKMAIQFLIYQALAVTVLQAHQLEMQSEDGILIH